MKHPAPPKNEIHSVPLCSLLFRLLCAAPIESNKTRTGGRNANGRAERERADRTGTGGQNGKKWAERERAGGTGRSERNGKKRTERELAGGTGTNGRAERERADGTGTAPKRPRTIRSKPLNLKIGRRADGEHKALHCMLVAKMEVSGNVFEAPRPFT